MKKINWFEDLDGFFSSQQLSHWILHEFLFCLRNRNHFFLHRSHTHIFYRIHASEREEKGRATVYFWHWHAYLLMFGAGLSIKPSDGWAQSSERTRVLIANILKTKLMRLFQQREKKSSFYRFFLRQPRFTLLKAQWEAAKSVCMCRY